VSYVIYVVKSSVPYEKLIYKIKIMKKIIAVAFAILVSQMLTAQDEDLLKLVGSDEEHPKKEYVDYSVKSSRVIMSHSMEIIRP